ncbi:Na(+)-translocating NADH-quinone reductase subunit A [bacterium BMS3Abin04]|nr:Na(+)-translocating NADH-quinone reductase subunit A [bacterium BMS3Abin04]
MTLHKIKKGLDIPIKGEPKQVVSEGNNVKTVAILGNDYVGMKPTMEVAVGDNVKLGQVLFSDKKNPIIKYTSPGAGKVVEINRGEKRKFLSIVIELSGSEVVTFESFSEGELDSLSEEKIKKNLIESGLWTSIRVRPFGKVAGTENKPHSIFITAMDTNPLAPSIERVLEGKEEFFKSGIKVLSNLTEGKTFLCKKPSENIPTADIPSLQIEEFTGPHPAGLPGTHIHFLDPVSRTKSVWYVNACDVASIGYLFLTGKIDTEKVVSLAGPRVKNPRLVKTRIGASLSDLTKNELVGDSNRIISGSVLSGRLASGAENYLGKYHQQVSVVRENTERKLFGWVLPTSNLFSVKKVLLSSFTPGKKFDFSTSINGGVRPIVSIGSYEKVMPLDILPTIFLRTIFTKDLEDMENLGILELDEEDLALCTFVSASKIDFGPQLREKLTIIEKEG